MLSYRRLSDRLDGIVQTHVFDSDPDVWSRGPDMAEGRWYPSVTPLRNGESLITSGGPAVPEVRIPLLASAISCKAA